MFPLLSLQHITPLDPWGAVEKCYFCQQDFLPEKTEATVFSSFKDTKIQKYKDTKIQRYTDTKVQKYRNTKIQKRMLEKLQRYKNTLKQKKNCPT